MLDKVNLLGVDITSSSENEILEYITKRLHNGGKRWYIVTPNPEIVVLANKDSSFRTILNTAEIALPDGVGVVWAAKLFKKGVKRRITGTDFMVRVCEKAAKEGLSTGFLGGVNGIANAVAECLQKSYPGLTIGFAGESWPKSVGNSFSLASELASPQVRSDIHLSRSSGLSPSDKIGESQFLNSRKSIDLLFVAYGAPKQEKWIYENLDKLPVKCAIGVGGAFDFIAGKVPRAPKFIQHLGLEWLFRLIVQPWRWRRQLVLIEFGWMVVKEWLKSIGIRSHNKQAT